MQRYAQLHCIYSSWPFFVFLNIIIANHYLSQCFAVQSPHTTVAIWFCDITKLLGNKITDNVISFVILHTYYIVSRECVCMCDNKNDKPMTHARYLPTLRKVKRRHPVQDSQQLLSILG